MRVHILSDLHLEFEPMDSDYDPRALGADLHILAGDIGPGLMGARWAARTFTGPTAYVLGNHEHYGSGPVESAAAAVGAACEGAPIVVLENRETILAGARVLGCTLWTDFALLGQSERAASMDFARWRMRDYDQAKVESGGRLSPEITAGMHARSLAWLKERLATPFAGKTIVVTHHAPHERSLLYEQVAARLDAAYASDLSELLALGQADLWAHGHTHVACDYVQGRTRVVSNPRGYLPSAPAPGFDLRLVVEI